MFLVNKTPLLSNNPGAPHYDATVAITYSRRPQKPTLTVLPRLGRPGSTGRRDQLCPRRQDSVATVASHSRHHECRRWFFLRLNARACWTSDTPDGTCHEVNDLAWSASCTNADGGCSGGGPACIITVTTHARARARAHVCM